MLERAYECPTSLALPQYPHTGMEAIVGTNNHQDLEDGKRTLPPQSKHLLAEMRDAQVEQAYVLDTRTMTVRHTGTSREYGEMLPWEIGTTLDVWGFLDVDHKQARILDYKSRLRTTRAADNWQVLSQVIAIMATTKAITIEAGLVYLDNGESDLHPFTLLDLPMLWLRLRKLVSKTLSAKADDPVRSGPWCTYCPAVSGCPAQRALVASFDGLANEVEHMPAERLGEVWVKWQALQKQGDRLRELVELRARKEPLPLPGGKMLTLVECKGRERADVGAMKRKLAEHGEDPDAFNTLGNPYTQLKAVNQKGT